MYRDWYFHGQQNNFKDRVFERVFKGRCYDPTHNTSYFDTHRMSDRLHSRVHDYYRMLRDMQHWGRGGGHRMGLVKGMVLVAIGVYSGIYIDQNYKVERVNTPEELWRKAKDLATQCKDYASQYKKQDPSLPSPTGGDVKVSPAAPASK